MNNEERDLIARFVARVGGASQAGFGSSVPATRPNLPPIDPEADSFIHQQLTQYPEATYRITQMAVVQEAALSELQNRIQRLQWENQQLQQQAQAQTQPARGGLFSGLFGGGQRNAPPPGAGQQGYGQPGYGQQQGYGAAPPPPQYAYPPNTNAGMFQRGGSGFLGSALTTAAGVAGGLVVGDALMNMFSGGHEGGGFGGGGGGFGGGGFGGDNNSYGDAGGGADPFGGTGADTGSDAWGGGDAGSGGDAGGGGDWGGGGGGDDSLF